VIWLENFAGYPCIQSAKTSYILITQPHFILITAVEPPEVVTSGQFRWIYVMPRLWILEYLDIFSVMTLIFHILISRFYCKRGSIFCILWLPRAMIGPKMRVRGPSRHSFYIRACCDIHRPPMTAEHIVSFRTALSQALSATPAVGHRDSRINGSAAVRGCQLDFHRDHQKH
jgi:hypothetical protein